MNLFEHNNSNNLLPADGIVNYFGKIFNEADAKCYLEELLANIEWKNDEAVIFGKHFITKRKAAWYGDKDFAYTYSNRTKRALPWTPALLKLKKITEERSGALYNSCLLNL